MDVERRFVLNGMAAIGLAGLTLANPVRSLANSAAPDPSRPSRPTLVLISRDVERSAFLAGIAASAAGEAVQVLRASIDLAFLQSLDQMLRAEPPLRMIGLVDDASAALIVELARAAGARQQWLGHHSAGPGQSRHSLLSVDLAQGCAGQLSQQLNACGEAFNLDERHLDNARASFEGAAQTWGGGGTIWPAHLGYLLASLGEAQAPPFDARMFSADPLSGHFVSFSIQS